MSNNRLYANGADLAEPYLSPLFGDLKGLPSTFLQTGTRDLFLSNTARMHRALRRGKRPRGAARPSRPCPMAASWAGRPKMANCARRSLVSFERIGDERTAISGPRIKHHQLRSRSPPISGSGLFAMRARKASTTKLNLPGIAIGPRHHHGAVNRCLKELRRGLWLKLQPNRALFDPKRHDPLQPHAKIIENVPARRRRREVEAPVIPPPAPPRDKMSPTGP